ncbi:hypothetical protein BU26DRAFT_290479 [Trematosphaeria pertusa]|uniref:Uncharacterized protein n=1 Tax=Trematosphaeria pertusa TaxID=390896 RepID=A0A6A6IHZ8_9PLEO|nr:uncharacterized protein BU26DRAFT_290479 [Trematosphaeria pertusa]KAF2249829.1 hypothetical protein BU26DRAFT_290479 [Trematosphaeria pertusa]
MNDRMLVRRSNRLTSVFSVLYSRRPLQIRIPSSAFGTDSTRLACFRRESTSPSPVCRIGTPYASSYHPAAFLGLLTEDPQRRGNSVEPNPTARELECIVRCRGREGQVDVHEVGGAHRPAPRKPTGPAPAPKTVPRPVRDINRVQRRTYQLVVARDYNGSDNQIRRTVPLGRYVEPIASACEPRSAEKSTSLRSTTWG